MALSFASNFLSIVGGAFKNCVPVTSGATSANAGEVVGLNSSGDIDISMMPTGPGSLNVVPISGNYAVLGLLNTSGSGTLTAVANRQYFVPFQVARPTVITNLGSIVNTASAGATFSVGIYADNGNAGGAGNQPTGSPLVSVTGLSTSATGAVVGAVASPYTLEPGVWYWRSIIISAAVSMKNVNAGGEVGCGLQSNGANVPMYYQSGSGTTLVSPFSGSLASNVTSPAPLMVYS